MIELFADQDQGGFFLAGKDAEQLIARDKPGYDGALPSGNSIAALVLSRLGRPLREDRFTQEAERVLRSFSRQMTESPTGLTALLLALADRLGPAQEVVITGPTPETRPLIQEYRRHFLPNATLLFLGTDAEAESLAGIVPFIRNLTPVEGRATAYVCETYACRRPVTTLQELRDVLGAHGSAFH